MSKMVRLTIGHLKFVVDLLLHFQDIAYLCSRNVYLLGRSIMKTQKAVATCFQVI